MTKCKSLLGCILGFSENDVFLKQNINASSIHVQRIKCIIRITNVLRKSKTIIKKEILRKN